ncbi:phage holin family protein [Lysobacter sp. KIS68-7]|uniref:phage holin family protein n=1 Tax=Lysobacter sp. KIS68-7 TaxID=2904252 RepID=UPI001E2DAFFC|nr:phage holin family protein [Lysobacter sp. KIS68-7]UHQ20223.1 phage holin family protein [Lysobacter sp. KIS68-7]
MGSEGTQDAGTDRAESPDRPTPGVADAFRELGDTGRATWAAGKEALTAFHILFKADLSLARSAFGRSLAFTAVAIVFGASAWLLLMAALVAWLSLDVGWTWPISLLVCGGGSLVVAGLAGWFAMRYFEHTRLQATRRQLARMGIGELSAMMSGAGSSKSAKEDADGVAAATNGEPVKKGMGVDITPP